MCLRYGPKKKKRERERKEKKERKEKESLWLIELIFTILLSFPSIKVFFFFFFFKSTGIFLSMSVAESCFGARAAVVKGGGIGKSG